MTIDKTYENGMGAMAPTKGFDQKFFFNASGGTTPGQAQAAAASQYPYPPKNCDDAQSTSDALANYIKTLNERIASNININDSKTEIIAYQTQKKYFDDYISTNKCVANALKADEAALQDQIFSQLNSDQSAQQKSSSTDTWLIFGTLGLLFVGAMVIIFKKSKPA